MLNIGQIFSAESQSIYDFLTIEGQGCYVPAYQRGYSWDSQNVERLLEDATLGLERQVEDKTSVRFLGSIIAVQGNSLVAAPPPLDRELPRHVLTIIDGQQRLCTIIVLNVLLHDRLSRLVTALESSEEDGVVAICADARDFLDDLLKSFQFEPRRAPGLNRIYPRLIRAMDDQWARTASSRSARALLIRPTTRRRSLGSCGNISSTSTLRLMRMGKKQQRQAPSNMRRPVQMAECSRATRRFWA